jgi:hypothetical protein
MGGAERASLTRTIALRQSQSFQEACIAWSGEATKIGQFGRRAYPAHPGSNQVRFNAVSIKLDLLGAPEA